MILKSVYIIGFGDPQVVKVGVAREPFNRMRLVASDLGVKIEECWNYVSSIQKDPHLIENRCHEALSKYLIGGFGPRKLYPREVFNCDINTAKTVLEEIIDDYEKIHPRFNRAKISTDETMAADRKALFCGFSEESIRAEHLRIIKNSNNWTISEFSKRLGVSPRTLESYFSGDRIIPKKITIELGRAR